MIIIALITNKAYLMNINIINLVTLSSYDENITIDFIFAFEMIISAFLCPCDECDVDPG